MPRMIFSVPRLARARARIRPTSETPRGVTASFGTSDAPRGRRRSLWTRSSGVPLKSCTDRMTGFQPLRTGQPGSEHPGLPPGQPRRTRQARAAPGERSGPLGAGEPATLGGTAQRQDEGKPRPQRHSTSGGGLLRIQIVGAKLGHVRAARVAGQEVQVLLEGGGCKAKAKVRPAARRSPGIKNRSGRGRDPKARLAANTRRTRSGNGALCRSKYSESPAEVMGVGLARCTWSRVIPRVIPKTVAADLRSISHLPHPVLVPEQVREVGIEEDNVVLRLVHASDREHLLRGAQGLERRPDVHADELRGVTVGRGGGQGEAKQPAPPRAGTVSWQSSQ